MAHPILLFILLILLAPLLPAVVLIGIPILLWAMLMVLLATGITAALTNPQWRAQVGSVILAAVLIAGLMFVGNEARRDARADPAPRARALPVETVAQHGATSEKQAAGAARSALDRALREPTDSISAKASDDPPLPRPDSPETPKSVSGDKQPPAWIHNSPYRVGNSYYVVAKSGPINDPLLRDESIDLKMLATANRYIDDVLYRGSNISTHLELDPKFLRYKCFLDQWPHDADIQPGDEVFVSMRFDQHFRDEIENRVRQLSARRHLEKAGQVAAALFTVLAGLYVYLQLTGRPKSVDQPLTQSTQ